MNDMEQAFEVQRDRVIEKYELSHIANSLNETEIKTLVEYVLFVERQLIYHLSKIKKSMVDSEPCPKLSPGHKIQLNYSESCALEEVIKLKKSFEDLVQNYRASLK